MQEYLSLKTFSPIKFTSQIVTVLEQIIGSAESDDKSLLWPRLLIYCQVSLRPSVHLTGSRKHADEDQWKVECCGALGVTSE